MRFVFFCLCHLLSMGKASFAHDPLDDMVNTLARVGRVRDKRIIRVALEAVDENRRGEIVSLVEEYASDAWMHEDAYVNAIKGFQRVPAARMPHFLQALLSYLPEDMKGVPRVRLIRHLAYLEEAKWEDFATTLNGIKGHVPPDSCLSDVSGHVSLIGAGAWPEVVSALQQNDNPHRFWPILLRF